MTLSNSKGRVNKNLKMETKKKEVLEKLKALPDQNLFLQMSDKSIKISAAIVAVEQMNETGKELVDIYSQNEKIHQIL